VSAADGLLAEAGMSETGIGIAAPAFEAAEAAWSTFEGRAAARRMLFVPGRIEVLGKHTDYAGGSTLTCAVERGLAVVYSPRRDGVVRLSDAKMRNPAEFRVNPGMTVPSGRWSTYPMTAARRLARNFGAPFPGADIAFQSTLPRAAGLSSSSALVTAMVLVLVDAARLAARPAFKDALTDPLAFATYLGCVENGQPYGPLVGDRGVGTFGGSEDHAAITCSAAGHVGHFEFCPVRHLASLPVPAGHVFVVGASGVVAVKTGNARERYNRSSWLVSQLLERWREDTGRADASLAEAVHSGPGAADRLADLARRKGAGGADHSAALGRRLAHFLLENETLVPAAAQALSAGDLDAFGRASDESQRASDDLLGNQVPETIALARLARLHGAAAASAFGAGFGGAVWALVEAGDAPRFIARWRSEYRRGVPAPIRAKSTFFVTPAGPPATGTSGRPLG
jgi:galactokinase